MIVVDESISDPLLIEPIKHWYQGQVITIRSLRPATVIKDDAVMTLLRRVNQPTFVTINVDDFWRKVTPDQNVCIIAIAIKQDQAIQLPALLRRVLNLPAFHTKTARIGKVLYVMPTYIDYYEIDLQTHRILW